MALFIFIHSLETSVLTFSGVEDRKRTRLIFLRCWCASASVIGKQNGWVASPFVINISFEREGSVMVPRGHIVCKQVNIITFQVFQLRESFRYSI